MRLWSPKNTKDHQLEILRHQISSEFNVSLSNYKELHEWSVTNYKDFWRFLLAKSSLPLIYSGDDSIAHESSGFELPPLWFPRISLNYAQHLLGWKESHKIAYYYTNERKISEGAPIEFRTFEEYRARVSKLVMSLKRHGVGLGDRIAGYLPNIPEALEIATAVSAIGAIWTCSSPDLGVSGVLSRFSQIRPSLLFSVEAVSYNNKTHFHCEKLKSVISGLPSLKKVVLIPFLFPCKEINLPEKTIFWHDFMSDESEDENELVFEPLPFGAPLFILYSSGTTGPPKCIVHSVGGTLLKHLEEHKIQGNRGAQDVLFYYTTTGWMMWNWMISALALGTSLLLYDGSPNTPSDTSLWNLIDATGVTVFGTSAKWLSVQEDRQIRPKSSNDLRTLKTILSTGSPLQPHSYDYVYKHIKSDLLLSSISGGTDIIACFMGENSTLPVIRGEIQSLHLGIGIEVWTEEGKECFEEPGELIVTTPFPSMPIGFMNDDSLNSLYTQAYFSKYPGVWAHGDYMAFNRSSGGIRLLGRSDGTLNPNGVRFGSAEIYNLIEDFEEIEDSLVVSVKPLGTTEEIVVLFVKMTAYKSFNEILVNQIKTQIQVHLSLRHVPSIIIPIEEIPYTLNGKKVEIAVKRILNRESFKLSLDSLENPKSLELYRQINILEYLQQHHR